MVTRSWRPALLLDFPYYLSLLLQWLSLHNLARASIIVHFHIGPSFTDTPNQTISCNLFIYSIVCIFSYAGAKLLLVLHFARYIDFLLTSHSFAIGF